ATASTRPAATTGRSAIRSSSPAAAGPAAASSAAPTASPPTPPTTRSRPRTWRPACWTPSGSIRGGRGATPLARPFRPAAGRRRRAALSGACGPRPAVRLSSRIPLRQPRHEARRLDADADHLADQPDDVFRVVRPVGVGADAAAFVLRDLVLVDDPCQGAAV